jgi:hypothetical protein
VHRAVSSFKKSHPFTITGMIRKIRFPVVDIRPLICPDKATTSEIGYAVEKIKSASRSHGFFHVVGTFRADKNVFDVRKMIS